MNGPRIVATAAFFCFCRSSTTPTPLVRMTANGPVLQRQPVSDASELLSSSPLEARLC
jgi:hypothetical protein